MGLLDTVLASVRCPECGSEAEREVQFKHLASALQMVRLGDFLPEAPAGRPLLRGCFHCEGGQRPRKEGEGHVVDCWVHLDRGFVTAVTLDAPERPTEVAWWMLERAGAEAADLRGALRAVGSIVSARREALQGEGDDRPALFRLRSVRTEGELLDQLERVLAHHKASRWPGGKD